MRPKCF